MTQEITNPMARHGGVLTRKDLTGSCSLGSRKPQAGRVSLLKEIAIFEDLLDFVNFQIENILGGLESRAQMTHELVDFEAILRDNVKFYSVEALSIIHRLCFPSLDCVIGSVQQVCQ